MRNDMKHGHTLAGCTAEDPEVARLRRDVLTLLGACGDLCSAMDRATGSTEWSADHVDLLDAVGEIDQRADEFREDTAAPTRTRAQEVAALAGEHSRMAAAGVPGEAAPICGGRDPAYPGQTCTFPPRHNGPCIDAAAVEG